MSTRFQAIAGYTLAALVAIAWVGTRLLAAGPIVTPAPEFDGSSISAGLGLAAAAVLIIRSRGSKAAASHRETERRP